MPIAFPQVFEVFAMLADKARRAAGSKNAELREQVEAYQRELLAARETAVEQRQGEETHLRHLQQQQQGNENDEVGADGAEEEEPSAGTSDAATDTTSTQGTLGVTDGVQGDTATASHRDNQGSDGAAATGSGVQVDGSKADQPQPAVGEIQVMQSQDMEDSYERTAPATRSSNDERYGSAATIHDATDAIAGLSLFTMKSKQVSSTKARSELLGRHRSSTTATARGRRSNTAQLAAAARKSAAAKGGSSKARSNRNQDWGSDDSEGADSDDPISDESSSEEEDTRCIKQQPVSKQGVRATATRNTKRSSALAAVHNIKVEKQQASSSSNRHSRQRGQGSQEVVGSIKAEPVSEVEGDDVFKSIDTMVVHR